VQRLYVSRPLYPPTAIAFSAVALVAGLLVAKQALFLPWLAALCLLYAGFGYAVVTLRCLAVFVPVGMACAGLAYLVFGDVAAVWQNTGRVVLLGLCAVPLVSTPPATLTRSLATFDCPRVPWRCATTRFATPTASSRSCGTLTCI
jgi:hypothetical protein